MGSRPSSIGQAYGQEIHPDDEGGMIITSTGCQANVQHSRTNVRGLKGFKCPRFHIIPTLCPHLDHVSVVGDLAHVQRFEQLPDGEDGASPRSCLSTKGPVEVDRLQGGRMRGVRGLRGVQERRKRAAETKGVMAKAKMQVNRLHGTAWGEKQEAEIRTCVAPSALCVCQSRRSR